MAAIGSMHEPLDDFVESMKASGNLSAETFEKYNNYEGPAAEKEQFFLDLLAQEPGGGKEVAEAYSALKAKDLYTLCTSPGPRMRSEALTVYGCGELCLELDCFYGLKEAHNIQDFITYLLQTGLYTGLMDPDPEKADKAVSILPWARPASRITMPWRKRTNFPRIPWASSSTPTGGSPGKTVPSGMWSWT